jgi:hypothetical protein
MKTRFWTGNPAAIGWILAQTLIVGLVIVVAIVAPPESGSMLLVPLGAGDPGTVLQRALDRGARLEGAGPFAGTFVVRAQRDRLAPEMLRAGVLMLAARPPLCGKAKAVAA